MSANKGSTNANARITRGSSLKDESRPFFKKSFKNPENYPKLSEGNTDLYPPFYKNVALDNLPPYTREGDIDYPFEETTGIGDENRIRGNWSSKVDFLLASLGFSIGFGYIWRFPYYCYRHGGGAFLLPYLIMLFLAGLPIFFMELILGQFASLGCISVWKVVPLFKGIGIAMFIVSCIISIYYNMITAWSIFYVVNSIQPTVPWASCGNYWNSENCSVWSRDLVEICQNRNGFLLRNGTCIVDEIAPDLQFNNSNLHQSFVIGHDVMPSLEYFHHHVLMLSDGADIVGTINWQLALYLLAAWLVIFFCMFKGVKTSGKVVYLTTIVPYVLLLVLLFRVLTLPGSANGLAAFLRPKWTKLSDPKVWGDAAVQVFYSLSSCWGCLATLASYNRFHNDCFKDMWLIGIANAFTVLFSGSVTFAIIGFVAYELNLDVADVDLKDGFGVAFVAYSEALSKLPVAPLCAVLFFLMLIMISVTTELFLVETVVTAICDEFPERLRKNHRHVLTFVCFAFYTLGVPLCTQPFQFGIFYIANFPAGMYWVLLLDHYSSTWCLLIIAFFECMAIAWVYGVDNFLDNIKWMIGYYPAPYMLWKLLWKFFCPMMLMTLLSFTWLEYQPPTYRGYQFPHKADLVGWSVSMLPVFAIPVTGLVQFCLTGGTFLQRWRDLMSPKDDWGPALAKHRVEYYPLQIPEARRPRDQFFPAEQDMINGPSSIFNNGYSQSPSFRDPSVMPDFQRETAI